MPLLRGEDCALISIFPAFRRCYNQCADDDALLGLQRALLLKCPIFAEPSEAFTNGCPECKQIQADNKVSQFYPTWCNIAARVKHHQSLQRAHFRVKTLTCWRHDEQLWQAKGRGQPSEYDELAALVRQLDEVMLNLCVHAP